MITVFLIIAMGIILIESLLRFYSLRFCVWPIKLAYAFNLLSDKKLEENRALHQRIVRGGFNSEIELFNHYAKISGKPIEEIKNIYRREKGWAAIFSNKYFSGGHTVIEQLQHMHAGMRPKANQQLNTMTINEQGFRNTGFDPVKDHGGKICLVLGGSAVFGVGATSDENTIPGRIGYYLNNWGDKITYYTLNYGMLGYNSLQELILFIQASVKPDYVVALSGWNEVDQALSSDTKISTMAQLCDKRANQPRKLFNLKSMVSRYLFLQVVMRFIRAFRAYDVMMDERRDENNLNIYTLF